MRKTAYIAIAVSVTLGVVVSFFGLTVASAQSNNAILCGLRYGANLDFSGGLGCNNTASSPAKPTSNTYVALGDSVAAGLGLLPAATGTSTDAQCGRSTAAYPNTVATNLGLPLITAACSGATAGDLFTKQSVSGPNIAAQLDTAFANGTPKVISITAGANDAHWAEFIRLCYATNCNTSNYTYAYRAYLAVLKAKLTYAFADIYTRSGGKPPKVVVTGYYNPLSTACTTQQQNITSGEISWLTTATASLNQTIQNAAGTYASFVHYVPVSFAGHDICSSQPWVQGVNDPAPFHPTAAGQAVIAKAVTAAAR